MAYSLDIIERLEHTMLRIHKSIEYNLHSDFVVRNIEFLVHLVLARRLMGYASHRKSHLFNETLGQKIVYIVTLHIKKLILDGRATAIDYKNDHFMNIWLFSDYPRKIK